MKPDYDAFTALVMAGGWFLVLSLGGALTDLLIDRSEQLDQTGESLARADSTWDLDYEGERSDKE
jgi:hypothetical protein